MELQSSSDVALMMGQFPCEFQADRPTFIFQLVAPDMIWHIYSHLYCSCQGLPPLKMASPCHHPLMSSTGASKCAKSHLEPPAMDDAPSWAGQGWKDPCLNSSTEKLHPGRSAQNSQGTFPMVGATSNEDIKSLQPSLKKQYRCE